MKSETFSPPPILASPPTLGRGACCSRCMPITVGALSLICCTAQNESAQDPAESCRLITRQPNPGQADPQSRAHAVATARGTSATGPGVRESRLVPLRRLPPRESGHLRRHRREPLQADIRLLVAEGNVLLLPLVRDELEGVALLTDLHGRGEAARAANTMSASWTALALPLVALISLSLVLPPKHIPQAAQASVTGVTIAHLEKVVDIGDK